MVKRVPNAESRTVRPAESGVALVLALMAVLLLSALGFTLVLTTSTEAMIAANYANAQEGLYAADAASERAMSGLLTVADWNAVLDGSTAPACADGPPGGARTLADGSTLDLAQVVNRANCGKPTPCSASDLTGNSTGDRPWGANNPVWRLYECGPVNDLAPTGTTNSPFYGVVLVADDPAETDDDPASDGEDPATNPGSGVLALRAEAFGPRGAHKVIEVTLARAQAGVRILSWREIR